MGFEWDDAKNLDPRTAWRSFEEVVELIEAGFCLGEFQNTSTRYKGQRVFAVQRDKEVLMVPFEKRENRYRLITAFPSERLTWALRKRLH